MDLDLFVEAFFIKMTIKVEKGNFSKIIKNLFGKIILLEGLGACYERSKSIKKRFRKWNEFQEAFLMDFGSILEVILEAKSFKNRCQNSMKKWMRFWRLFLDQTGGVGGSAGG